MGLEWGRNNMSEYDFVIQLVKDASARLKVASKSAFETTSKGGDERDVVTSVDLEINAFLVGEITKAFPADRISSEEGGGVENSNGREWVLDPVDGSANFARAIPHYAVCIALLVDGVPTVGAVYNPMTDELFSFEKGKGAFLNGEKITVSSITEPAKAQGIIIVGHQPPLWDWGAAVYRSFLEHLKKLKALGSSALDICFVAAGRADIVAYGTLTTRDTAAAIGVLREAGGEIYTLHGAIAELSDTRQTIVATANKELFDASSSLLHRELLP
jgi:myo-inositol-1(or 4)-monophosphatase